jgi:diaminopimelate decarboxylase
MKVKRPVGKGAEAWVSLPELERLWLEPALRTPLLVYCERELLGALDRLRDSIQEGFRGPFGVHFAVKSCYRLPVLRSLLRAGAGVEVMSANEYRLARAAGFSGSQILCNGLGRSAELLATACADGARIVLDSLHDLENLPAGLAEPPGRVRLGIRIKPDLSAFPDSAYAGDRHKLGLRPGSPEFQAILEICRSHPVLDLNLLHVHAASVECSSQVFRHLLSQLAHVAKSLETSGAAHITSVDLGGGMAAAAAPIQPDIFADIGAAFAQLFGDRIELLLEPGRYLVDSAAYVLATVTAVKPDGDLFYLVTDAGTNTLMPFSESSYTLLRPKGDARGAFRVSVVDGITSLRSVLIHETRLESLPRPGDRILLANCGAYTSALASFWVYDPIPVAFLSQSGDLSMDLSPEQIAQARSLLLGI